MTIIVVPTAVQLSPANAKDLRLDTDTRMVSDQSGNEWHADELADSVESAALRKWLDENYPR